MITVLFSLFVDQLDAIKNVTLSSVICANFDLFTLQPSAFRLISPYDNT